MSALDDGEWSSSRLVRVTSGERGPNTGLLGRMGLTSSMTEPGQLKRGKQRTVGFENIRMWIEEPA
jgi:hypothetical protein